MAIFILSGYSTPKGTHPQKGGAFGSPNGDREAAESGSRMRFPFARIPQASGLPILPHPPGKSLAHSATYPRQVSCPFSCVA